MLVVGNNSIHKDSKIQLADLFTVAYTALFALDI